MTKHFVRTCVLALGVTALAAGPALAVTVTNQSGKAHEITVDLGANEPKTTIEAGKSAKLDCPEGCELRVNSGNSYGLPATSGDKVVLGEDGMLSHAGSDKQASNGKADAGGSKTMVD